jgi:Holliday junction resolvase
MRLNVPNAPQAVRASIGGRRSRDKGARAERVLVRSLQAHGFAAERVPLSGSVGGSYVGDITVPMLGIDRTVEVKEMNVGNSSEPKDDIELICLVTRATAAESAA